MKKSTYIMLAAFLGGLLGMCVVTAAYVRHNSVEKSRHEFGGESVSVMLSTEPVHKVTFAEKKCDSYIEIRHMKGIMVLESDTARSVTLHTREGWLPYLECVSDSGSLTVSIDYPAIAARYPESEDESGGRRPRSVRYRSADYVIATLTMPHGGLREVAARKHTMYLDSVQAEVIASKVDDRLVLNNTHIATLNSRGKTINELKLNNSTVGDAVMNAVDRNFRVTCTNDASRIGVLKIDSIYRYNKNRNINFRFDKANIGEVRYSL